jgi:pyruvate/2-oxoglutarate dehydrogenase complex dihydrolipoamide acyltransferase (E2) component
MPKWGVTMEEGMLREWLKKTGDPVVEGEPLFVAETDKAEGEVESPGSGVLGEILVAAGVTVPTGTLLARLYSAEEWRGRGGAS